MSVHHHTGPSQQPQPFDKSPEVTAVTQQAGGVMASRSHRTRSQGPKDTTRIGSLEQRGLEVRGAGGMVQQQAAGAHSVGMNHLGVEASSGRSLYHLRGETE